jgi:hypothetical protein
MRGLSAHATYCVRLLEHSSVKVAGAQVRGYYPLAIVAHHA